MDSRPNLQNLLENVLGNRNVYFQPPSSIKLCYPAIVYSREEVETKFANNFHYLDTIGYKVTLIDKDPECPIFKELLKLPYCKFDRHYVADNLHHDVFTIYYKKEN